MARLSRVLTRLFVLCKEGPSFRARSFSHACVFGFSRRGARRMLVDSLAFQIEKSGCLDAFWGKLDRGEDAALAVASSARPFMTAARFAHEPQPTLVVVAGRKRRLLSRETSLPSSGRIACCVFPSVVINRLRPSIPMRAWSPSAWRPRIRLRAGEASSWSLLRDPLSVFCRLPRRTLKLRCRFTKGTISPMA